MTIASKELKRRARICLTGKYFSAVSLTSSLLLFSLLLSLLLGQASPVMSESPVRLISFLIMGFLILILESLLEVGLVKFSYAIREGGEIPKGTLFYAFRNQPDTFILVAAARHLVTLIWFVPAAAVYMRTPIASNPAEALTSFAPVFLLALAGAVPAFLCSLPYSQAFYILLDKPYCSAREALEYSRKLMRGNYLRLIYLRLSFIPWYLLQLGSYGIAILWFRPYYHTTMSQFHQSLKSADEEAKAKAEEA